MKWNIKRFQELNIEELYEICKARYEVFGCEQKVFQENDLDDVDKDVYHLFLEDKGTIAAYARLIPSGIKYDGATIGRVLVLKEYRRRGIATELLKRGIDFLENNLKEKEIVISAQLYAKDLYEAVGFKIISDIYEEVEIPHVKMKLVKAL